MDCCTQPYLDLLPQAAMMTKQKTTQDKTPKQKEEQEVG